MLRWFRWGRNADDVPIVDMVQVCGKVKCRMVWMKKMVQVDYDMFVIWKGCSI